MNEVRLRNQTLAEIGALCGAHQLRFRAGEEFDPRFCYELFFRALVHDDQAAWQALYEQFEGQVRWWIRRSARFWAVSQEESPLVNEAFSRMALALRGLSPRLFRRRFPALGALLAYLRRCTAAAVASSAGSPPLVALDERTVSGHTEDGNPEAIVIARARDRALSETVDELLQDEAERLVFVCSYQLDMSVPEIMQRYPARFTDRMQIYRLRARILRRLRGHPKLLHYLK